MAKSGPDGTKNGMQATLIRFDPQILTLVRAEAERCGVSVAQYVREATLARVAYTAGRRGDQLYDGALNSVGAQNAALRAEAKQISRQAERLRAQARTERDHRG